MLMISVQNCLLLLASAASLVSGRSNTQSDPFTPNNLAVKFCTNVDLCKDKGDAHRENPVLGKCGAVPNPARYGDKGSSFGVSILQPLGT